MSHCGRYSILATDLTSDTGNTSAEGLVVPSRPASQNKGARKACRGIGGVGGLFPKILLLVTNVEGSGSMGTSGSWRTLHVFHK